MERVDSDLESHYDSQEVNEMISTCCAALVEINDLGDDVCDECKNTCEIISRGDWLYNQENDAECDKADAEKELKNED